MNLLSLALLLLLLAPEGKEPPDANTAEEQPRPRLGFRVFGDLDKPLTGRWSLFVPDEPSREIEIEERRTGRSTTLVGIDQGSGAEILILTPKSEGIGYEGTLDGVFERCDLTTVRVTDFLPLGDTIVMKFEIAPTKVPCPPVDSGAIARFFAFSQGGGPVRLRDLSELSSTTIRETYSIGGERQTEISHDLPIGAVSVEVGSEVKFVRRIKAPLDGSYWFEVEAILAEDAGIEPPRGFVPESALRVEGSLSLKRSGSAGS